MSQLLAIDPGKHACAFADFFRGELVRVAYEKPGLQWHGVGRVVVELPQQRGRFSKVRMSTLLELAFVGGQAGGPGAEFVTVAQWKGSAQKEPMHRRAVGKVLSSDEQHIIRVCKVPEKKLHNVLDAVCIGLVILGRM